MASAQVGPSGADCWSVASDAQLPLPDENILDDIELDPEQAARWNLGGDEIRKIRQQLRESSGGGLWALREPCRFCREQEAGYLVKRGGQNTVRCARCGRLQYNAPKTETGEAERTVDTLRSAIKPSQQARVLNRDGGQCVLCARREGLNIGHLLSIEDGAELGVDARLLNDDANLAAMCEACNLGLRHAERSVFPKTYATIMWRLVEVAARDADSAPDDSLREPTDV
jgi:hypothetical protein